MAKHLQPVMTDFVGWLLFDGNALAGRWVQVCEGPDPGDVNERMFKAGHAAGAKLMRALPRGVHPAYGSTNGVFLTWPGIGYCGLPRRGWDALQRLFALHGAKPIAEQAESVDAAQAATLAAAIDAVMPDVPNALASIPPPPQEVNALAFFAGPHFKQLLSTIGDNCRRGGFLITRNR